MFNFFLQALASYIAIATFLVVLNVQRKMLLPGGILGMLVWLTYLLLLGPTNLVLATFIAAILGAFFGQIMSILFKTPSVIFSLAILAPLVPGYHAYMATTYFVSEQHAQALAHITTVLTLALVIPIGMASGTIFHRLFKSLKIPKYPS